MNYGKFKTEKFVGGHWRVYYNLFWFLRMTIRRFEPLKQYYLEQEDFKQKILYI